MRPADLLQLAAASLVRARLRSVMMLVATAIGVAAVVVLTSLGEEVTFVIISSTKPL